MQEYYFLELNEDTPRYIQISNHIKKLIEHKVIEDGEKLPAIRTYAKFLGVNNDTIISAYKRLSDCGFALKKMGSGTYAKRKELYYTFNKTYSNTFKRINAGNRDKIIDFAGETTNEANFPVDDLKNIINKVLDRDGASAFISQNPLGYEKLRSTINKEFWNNKHSIDDILIISGAQQGIDIASKAMLNINDNVIVEKPTYGGALSVFKWRRANIYEVPMEMDGINLSDFEKILKKNKISCFYTMSYFQNPTGISYSMEKKKKIMELADKYDFYIIEDDYLSDLIYEDDLKYASFKSLDESDRVIYIKSFTKVFLPGIRLGYIIPPKIFNESFRNSKFNTDITTSSLMQRALEMFISKGFYKKNIKALKKEYKARYEYMESLIDKELGDEIIYNKPSGGLTFYLTLRNKDISSKDLFLNLSKNNVYITPGVLFFRNVYEGEHAFRIGFSQVDNDKIKKGIEIIKKELEKCRI